MDYNTEIISDSPWVFIRGEAKWINTGFVHRAYDIMKVDPDALVSGGPSGGFNGITSTDVSPYTPTKDAWPYYFRTDGSSGSLFWHLSLGISSYSTYNLIEGEEGPELDLRGTFPAPGVIELITIEFWMYWPSFSNDGKYACEYSPGTDDAGFGSGFHIIPNHSSGEFLFGAYDYTDSFTRPSAAAWHHYVFVIERGAAPSNTAYVDGVAQSLNTVTHASSNGYLASLTTAYFLSSYGAATRAPADSCIDAIAIYPHALSADRALAHYEAGAIGTVGMSGVAGQSQITVGTGMGRSERRRWG